VGQASKGLGDLWRSLGLLSWRVLRRWAALPPQIYVDPQPEQHAQQKLMEKQVVYHFVPPPTGWTVGMPSGFRAGNLSAGQRYTTIRKAGDAYNRTRLSPFLKALSRRWLAWSR
jgi:hypothetical protein